MSWRVVRFEIPSMARMRETERRQGPDLMPVLQEAFRQQVQLEKTEQPGRLMFNGGRSMGGRVASLLVDELAVPPTRQGARRRRQWPQFRHLSNSGKSVGTLGLDR